MKSARVFAFLVGLVTPPLSTVALGLPVACADGSAAPAESPERRAARSFAEGQAAFEAHEYRRAAQLFESAYALKPHPAALWNAARSWHHAGEDVLCANTLERYLRDPQADPATRDDANATLADVRKRVARVQLKATGVSHVQLDGTPRNELEGTVYVVPGEHVLAAEDGQGTPVKKSFLARRGETVTVTLAAGSAATAASAEDEASPPVKEPAKPEPGPETRSGARVLSPWVLLGGAALVTAGAAATTVSGLDTLQKRNAFIVSRTQANLEAGFAAQSRTNILVGVTVGAAVVTALAALFFVDWKGSKGKPSSSQPATAWLGLAP